MPQGSVLGPILFLIYINDLPENINCNMKLFADDTSLFTVVYDTHRAAEDLNSDLRSSEDWAFKLRMSFNPDPMKQAVELIFSRKRPTANHLPLYFNGIQVARVDEHKHLGIILDSKLSFSQHIQSIIAKAKQRVGMLCLDTYLEKHLMRCVSYTFVHIWTTGVLYTTSLQKITIP